MGREGLGCHSRYGVGKGVGERMVFTCLENGSLKSLEGKNAEEIARMTGKTPTDAFFDTWLQDDLRSRCLYVGFANAHLDVLGEMIKTAGPKEEHAVIRRPKVFLSFMLLASLVAPATGSAQLMNKRALTLAAAKQIAAAAEAEATKNNWRVVIAIVDDGGHLIYLQRTDETPTGSLDVAIQKAWSAAAYKRPTKALEDAVAGGRNVILALPHVMPIEGGLPIVVDGKVIGGIGVSGGTAQQDGITAKAGVDALPTVLGR